MIDQGDWRATVDAFRRAADHAEHMICRPEVADRWNDASALARFTVGGIAGHLLGVLRSFDRRCDLAVPEVAVPASPADGYASVRLSDENSLDEAQFRLPRDAGERLALRGQSVLCREFSELLGRLDARLRAEQPDRQVLLPDATTSTTLREYTITRIVELVVHADDLARSVGARDERLPADAVEMAIAFLDTTVRRRIGDEATLRALAGRAGSDALRAL